MFPQLGDIWHLNCPRIASSMCWFCSLAITSRKLAIAADKVALSFVDRESKNDDRMTSLGTKREPAKPHNSVAVEKKSGNTPCARNPWWKIRPQVKKKSSVAWAVV